MATILIVDDRLTNRQLLVTLLGYEGHRLLEAANGAEALEIARAERPGLIITDIIMPVIDGYELAHQLRADPNLAKSEIIFYTAGYHEREVRSLARQCGVTHILTKPAEPEVILKTARVALGLSQTSVASPPAPEAFDREHLRVITDKLAEKVSVLETTNLRLKALVELGQQLALERDPVRLLERFCHEAREIIGAKYAAINIKDETGQALKHFFVSGLDIETAAHIGDLSQLADVLEQRCAERGPVRRHDLTQDPHTAGFPAHHLVLHSFLGVPIASPTQLYGLVYMGEKLGAAEFSEQDEQCLTMLAAQMAVAYENALRLDEIQNNVAELEARVQARTAELAEANARLEHLSLTDELTGLYNRRGFITLADQRLKLARRQKNNLCLIFVDLDGMKRINDQWGHAAGDAALKATASLLRQTLRDSDIIARMGGDEFTALAIDLGESASAEDGIRTRLQANVTAHNEQSQASYVLSLSLGVIRMDPNTIQTIDDLLAKADAAMYVHKQNKKQGRTNDSESRASSPPGVLNT